MTDYQLRKLASSNTRANRKQLVAEIKKQANITQKRVASLQRYEEKVGPIRAHSFALDKLQGSLKSLGITTSTTGSLKSRQNSTLARQLSALQEFNRSMTSTPTGIRKQESILRSNLKSAGFSVPRGKNWDRMVEIFSSEAFKEFETFGSGRRFAIATEATKRKVTDEDLDKIMQMYREGLSLDEAWYKQAKFKPLLLDTGN